MKQEPRLQRGATLLEAVVAAGLLATSAGMLAQWHAANQLSQTWARQQAQARAVANVHLESLRHRAHAGERVMAGTSTKSPHPDTTPLELSWQAQPDADQGLVTLRVDVQWPRTGDGVNRLHLQSLVSTVTHLQPIP